MGEVVAQVGQMMVKVMVQQQQQLGQVLVVVRVGLVVVVVGQVPQARAMLEVVVEVVTVTLEGMVATRITVPMEVPPAVPHRAVLPLSPSARRNCSLAVVADPEGSMTQPASQGLPAMGVESFILQQIQ